MFLKIYLKKQRKKTLLFKKSFYNLYMIEQILAKVNKISKDKFIDLSTATSHSNGNLLNFCLSLLHSTNILNHNEWWFLLKNTDLNQKNIFGDCALSIYLLSNEKILSFEQLEYFIMNTNLTIKDSEGSSILTTIIHQKLFLPEKTWDFIIRNINLLYNETGQGTPLMIFLTKHSKNGLFLTEGQWDFLINNSDLSATTDYGFIPYIHYYLFKEKRDIVLNESQINKLKAPLATLDLNYLNIDINVLNQLKKEQEEIIANNNMQTISKHLDPQIKAKKISI